MSQKNRFRFKALLVGFVLAKIGLSVFYLADINHLTDLFTPHQIAVAQDEKAGDASSKNGDADASSDEAAPPENIEQLAEVQAIIGQLEDERNRLKEKEKQLKKERMQLESLKRDIEEKIDQLTAVQKKIDDGIAKKEQLAKQGEQQKSAAETTKIKHLVKMYSSMNPKKAAEIFDKMDMDVIHQVFSNMKGDQVGKILSFVDRDRAAKITERLAPKVN